MQYKAWKQNVVSSTHRSGISVGTNKIRIDLHNCFSPRGTRLSKGHVTYRSRSWL